MAVEICLVFFLTWFKGCVYFGERQATKAVVV